MPTPGSPRGTRRPASCGWWSSTGSAAVRAAASRSRRSASGPGSVAGGHSGPTLVGREALIGRPALEANAARIDPACVRRFKPYLGREARRTVGVLGLEPVTVRDAARLFLRELLVEIKRSDGRRVRELAITTPVESYESYRAELQAIAGHLGVARPRFVVEPVAAALGYGIGVDREPLKQAATPQLEAEIRHTIAAILARIGPIEAGRLSLLDDTAGRLSRPEQDGELTLERDR